MPPITKHRNLKLPDYVKDPEIPVINALELGGCAARRCARIVALIRYDRP